MSLMTLTHKSTKLCVKVQMRCPQVPPVGLSFELRRIGIGCNEVAECLPKSNIFECPPATVLNQSSASSDTIILPIVEYNAKEMLCAFIPDNFYKQQSGRYVVKVKGMVNCAPCFEVEVDNSCAFLGASQEIAEDCNNCSPCVEDVVNLPINAISTALSAIVETGKPLWPQ